MLGQELIGKMIYTQEPKLVSDNTDTFLKPVLVHSIDELENSAAVIINRKIIIGYIWLVKLIDVARVLEVANTKD